MQERITIFLSCSWPQTAGETHGKLMGGAWLCWNRRNLLGGTSFVRLSMAERVIIATTCNYSNLIDMNHFFICFFHMFHVWELKKIKKTARIESYLKRQNSSKWFEALVCWIFISGSTGWPRQITNIFTGSVVFFLELLTFPWKSPSNFTKIQRDRQQWHTEVVEANVHRHLVFWHRFSAGKNYG